MVPTGQQLTSYGELMKDHYASIVGIALTLCAGAFLLWMLLAPIHAQQTPYTTYRLKFTDQKGIEHPFLESCLIVTAQGYAVILDRRCPQ